MAHKTHLRKVKRTEIMESMLSDHNDIRSEITNSGEIFKFSVIKLLNNTYIKKEVSK